MEYVAAILGGVAIMSTTLAWIWRTERNEARAQIRFANDRAALADEMARRVVLAVGPLIEQTDWMTGRWHGQFGELVAMEKERNKAVVKARRFIMELPEVRDLGPSGILAGAGTDAGRKVWGA